MSHQNNHRKQSGLESVMDQPYSTLKLKKGVLNAIRFYEQNTGEELETIRDLTKIDYLVFISQRGVGEGSINNLVAKLNSVGAEVEWTNTASGFKKKYNF